MTEVPVSPSALVTGGGTGIGRATAIELARRGARVMVCGRRREPLEGVAAEIGCELVVADLGEADGPAAAVSACVEALGSIDVLVNNASIVRATPLAESSPGEWREVIDVCLRGAALCTTAAVPSMKAAGGGRVVNVASINAAVSEPESAAYSAAKAGIVSLTRSSAVDLAADGIRANCVGPGWVRAPMSEPFLAETTPESLRRLNPLGRVGMPEEIAEVIAFLALESPDYLTGQTIYVDGGQTAAAPLP